MHKMVRKVLNKITVKLIFLRKALSLNMIFAKMGFLERNEKELLDLMNRNSIDEDIAEYSGNLTKSLNRFF